MGGVTEIRAMEADDVVGAEAAWDQAYRSMLAEHHMPVPPGTPELTERAQRRMRYLRETDPEGAWVADDGGKIVGLAEAQRRGDIWVLAILGVVPGFQDHGVGRSLLERALAYGSPMSPGAIFSSPDPRAMYRYLSAGFTLHPTAAAYGPVRRPLVEPPGVRVGSVADLEQVQAVDRTVRGVDRGGDIEFLLATGLQLLVDDRGGYAVVQSGRLTMLSALDEEIATDLVVSTMARCPTGEPMDVSWITAEQQWAFSALARGGVPLQIQGSVMMRGGWQPQRPYLANGIFG
jgi:GNAT superfamily N-acetyltransferase